MRVLWQIEKIIFFKIPVYGVNLIKSFMSQHIPYVCKYLFLWIKNTHKPNFITFYINVSHKEQEIMPKKAKRKVSKQQQKKKQTRKKSKAKQVQKKK